ncbi:MAG: YezD family protein [Hominisplanchenecus sp.]
MKSRKNEVDSVEKTKVGEEDLKRIKEYIESVRFGTVTVIVQDGNIVQLERNEKVRLK